MLLINYYLNRFKAYLTDIKGQGMVEYALIIGLVALVVIAVLVLFGDAIGDKFQEIVDTLNADPATL